MGEIRVDILLELKKDNNGLRRIDLQIFADALRLYHEAARNIAKNGAICAHPRTGSPLENPYLKIRAQQAVIIGRIRQIKSDRVLRLLEDAEGEAS